METAGEGGLWGMATLASYMKNREEGESLEWYLAGQIFVRAPGITAEPDKETAIGFAHFMEGYVKGLPIEQPAVENL